MEEMFFFNFSKVKAWDISCNTSDDDSEE